MKCSGLYDLVIIGGGPGGLTAGIYAMRAALKTALVEMAVPGGGNWRWMPPSAAGISALGR
jgi:thioredoxin reductase (NADPH)